MAATSTGAEAAAYPVAWTDTVYVPVDITQSRYPPSAPVT